MAKQSGAVMEPNQLYDTIIKDNASLFHKETTTPQKKKDKVLMPTILPSKVIKNKKRKTVLHAREKTQKKDKKPAKLFPLKRKMGKKTRSELKEKRREANKDNPQPHTIESMRVEDVTIIEPKEDKDLEVEEATDKFSDYFSKKYEPKVLVTTSQTSSYRTHTFVRELALTIPNSLARWRKLTTVDNIIAAATKRKFTDVLIVNEDKRGPNGLLVIHLPSGPSAYFRLSNVSTCKEMKKNRRHLKHYRPELLMNNFKTLLGQTVARMLASLYHYEPEFKGRNLCTFHNQRDFIFFRHHRYEIRGKDKVRLQELGPKFTMKLQWLQEGAFSGDYEWTLKRHMLEANRRAFHL